MRKPSLLVVVAALGYFVDIYDLLLFGIVRTASLKDLHVPDSELLDAGVLLLNSQMGGLLLGGILWGVLGDKRGRLSVLFASIFLYSAANLANAYVQDIGTYAILRFIAGVGLAGELGAGITLVSESMPKETRGIATTIVASVGIIGAVVAATVADLTSWRTAFIVGGAMGLGLLVLRVGAYESHLYQQTSNQEVQRGSFLMLFTDRSRLKRYACIVLVAVPIWYSIGILVTFAPEFGKAMGLTELPTAGRAIFYCYGASVLGDFSSGIVSHFLKSRLRVLGLYLGFNALAVIAYFLWGGLSLNAFYACCAGIGFAVGYWAVFVSTAAEQFGTNLRATATTTSPNIVRGMVLPLTAAFQALKPSLGVLQSAMVVGAGVLVIAVFALTQLEETFGKDLDFVEK